MDGIPVNTKKAVLYRTVTQEKTCPHGLKAKDLLRRKGYEVRDNHLRSAEEIAAFKSQHGVKTVPQIFINEERIGGFDDLQAHFGATKASADQKTYKPVIALFLVAAALALNIIFLTGAAPNFTHFFEYFVSSAMILLGLQKLQDIDRFATMFLNYDLLAQRWVRYGYIYPFIETLAGILMMTGALTLVTAPVTLVAASIGAISVFKAVYLDKRDLKCACVGGDSKVPLGFVSLLENIMMIAMALWMLMNI